MVLCQKVASFLVLITFLFLGQRGGVFWVELLSVVIFWQISIFSWLRVIIVTKELKNKFWSRQCFFEILYNLFKINSSWKKKCYKFSFLKFSKSSIFCDKPATFFPKIQINPNKKLTPTLKTTPQTPNHSVIFPEKNIQGIWKLVS